VRALLLFDELIIISAIKNCPGALADKINREREGDKRKEKAIFQCVPDVFCHCFRRLHSPKEKGEAWYFTEGDQPIGKD